VGYPTAKTEYGTYGKHGSVNLLTARKASNVVLFQGTGILRQNVKLNTSQMLKMLKLKKTLTFSSEVLLSLIQTDSLLSSNIFAMVFHSIQVIQSCPH
jgi:hypothetical protein